MSALFSLLERLAGLAAPTVLALQGLLHATLAPVPNANEYYAFYEGRSRLEMIGRVDFRVPREAATKGAFLVLDLKGPPLDLKSFERRFGPAAMTDVSHHHPDFIGYSAAIHGRPIGLTVDAKTRAIRTLSIDYRKG